jgi:hypothetical protein
LLRKQWSICSGIWWSVCPGNGGQFKLESGGQFHRFFHYSLLEEIFHRYNGDYDIYISPLGTRPHCLGAAIFATKYSSSYLIYDFPVEKKYRSNEILKVDLFNITKFIY